jgi:hypothetical protein
LSWVYLLDWHTFSPFLADLFMLLYLLNCYNFKVVIFQTYIDFLSL